MRRAAAVASLVTGAALLLLLSRSEIRKTLNPLPTLIAASLLWLGVFLGSWYKFSRRRSGGG